MTLDACPTGDGRPTFYPLLGSRVQPMTMEALTGHVARCIAHDRQQLVTYQNMHGLRMMHKDEAFARFHALVQCVYIDGMPLIALGRLLGYPFRREHRVTCVDWFPHLLAQADASRWKVFFLGNTPQAITSIRQFMQDNYPQAVFDAHHGYELAEHRQAVIERINAMQPDLLIVGMGMPLQERWLLEHHEKLSFGVALNVGAAMDYFIGAVPTPPRWMGRMGIEWLHRLASEPRRLAGRYLIEPWFLVGPLLRDIKRVYLSR